LFFIFPLLLLKHGICKKIADSFQKSGYSNVYLIYFIITPQIEKVHCALLFFYAFMFVSVKQAQPAPSSRLSDLRHFQTQQNGGDAISQFPMH